MRMVKANPKTSQTAPFKTTDRSRGVRLNDRRDTKITPSASSDIVSVNDRSRY